MGARPTPVPHSREAEEAVLGAVLIDPDAFFRIDLRSQDFYIVRHRFIWDALVSLHGRGVSPDFVTLCDELDARHRLSEVGGAAYLSALVNNVPSALNAEHYAELVSETARRRAAIQVAHDLTVAAYDGQASMDAATAQALDRLSVGGGGKPAHISEAASAVYDYVVEKSKNPGQTWGIPTGLIDLDRLTGGLSGLWYLAGPPGIGKSILMMQIVINAAKAGHPVGVFELEMSKLALAMRAVSAEGEIATHNMRTGYMPDEDWPALAHAVEVIASLPVYICDDPYLTTTKLRAQVSLMRAMYGIELFALDYMYLLADAEEEDLVRRTELLSKRVMAITRSAGIPALTVNSVTKEGMNGKPPSNTDIRGSGQLIHDADVVAFLSKHEYMDSIRKLTLTKGRDLGEIGTVEIVKTAGYPSFRNAEVRDRVMSERSADNDEYQFP